MLCDSDSKMITMKYKRKETTAETYKDHIIVIQIDIQIKSAFEDIKVVQILKYI